MGSYLVAKHLIVKAVELGWSLPDIACFKWYLQLYPMDGQDEYFKVVVEWSLIEFACVVKADMEFIKYLLTVCYTLLEI